MRLDECGREKGWKDSDGAWQVAAWRVGMRPEDQRTVCVLACEQSRGSQGPGIGQSLALFVCLFYFYYSYGVTPSGA